MRITIAALICSIAIAGCEKTPSTPEAAEAPGAEKAAALKPSAPPNSADTEEGSGEPMDDVDEEESASDRSGTNEPASADEEDEAAGEEIDVEE